MRRISHDRHRCLDLMLILLLCGFVPASLARKTRLTWINGIGHTNADMQLGKQFLSEKFGGKQVTERWNPTAMAHDEDFKGYLADLSQAGSQKLGRMTREVKELTDHLRAALEQVGTNGRVVHICHSQGALITALACKQLTASEMSRMEVLSFGGAATFRKSDTTPFVRCINYYSVNDPLLLVVPEAGQSLRSGLLEEADEFCFLAPRMGDPIRDHKLLNPTYAQALEWEGRRFQKTYVSPATRVVSAFLAFVACFVRLVAAKLALLFWVLFRPVVAGYALACAESERLLRPLRAMFVAHLAWIRKQLGMERYVSASQVINAHVTPKGKKAAVK
jgi:hypothetical protein